jgi:hypothetical protein
MAAAIKSVAELHDWFILQAIFIEILIGTQTDLEK